MFLGAYLAGLVPLMASIKPSRLRLITVFGAGLLVGSALIVIIPEGVAMHYAAAQVAHSSSHEAATSADGYAEAVTLDGDVHHARRLLTLPETRVAAAAAENFATTATLRTRATRKLSQRGRALKGVTPDVAADTVAAISAPVGGGSDAAAEEHDGHEHDGHAHASHAAGSASLETPSGSHEHSGHWQIGAALALGFAFQLIVGE